MKKCKVLQARGKHLSRRWLFTLVVVCTLAIVPVPGQAANEVLEARIRATVEKIDAASNKQDLEALLVNYAPGFRSADGLTYEATRKAVAALWSKLSQPTYQTNVTAVVPQKNQVRVNATTFLNAGYKSDLGEPGKLESQVETSSLYEEQQGAFKLVSQRVLAERTKLSIGSNPPQVNLNLPEAVRVGRPFKIEAILPTSLQKSPALGGIRLSPITARSPGAVEAPALEPLRTGGLFKTGQAPQRPTDQAITLAIVRQGGLLLVNQRLKVTEGEPPKAATQPELAKPADEKPAAKSSDPAPDNQTSKPKTE
ncbi:hypothetical protein GKIL_4092 [Gloeobacter kilaueensis JS1]|uniref:Uncharacterized protein n=1 Tax=Gloeobacter kilaueensis (strain ATCC BAA-2537 / CCAP 1431/1 / ULC 316 / JS1) TaxID=1183438 RepID=U5QNA0_GLOK1|nr:hypothetical protein GKIL_4092 [Gloeobacter kilaueensis JS1]